MKIMTAMYTVRRGGAYDRFLMMLEALLERGCEIHCLSLTPIQIRSSLFHNHVIRLPFPLNQSGLTKPSVLVLFPLYSLLVAWREKINILIAFNFLYAFLQTMSKWILKKPMVTFIRGDLGHALKMRGSLKNLLWLNRIIEHFGLMASDRILTVNSAIRSDILAAVGNRRGIDVQILPNNIVMFDSFNPDDRTKVRDRYRIPSGARVLVTAGILNRGKNVELLLKVLQRVGATSPFLFVIGDGSVKEDISYLEHLKGMVKELGLREKVIFTGWLPKEECWRIFRASDLFLLPSLKEGMPNVLLEALGLDLPCLGSRIAGIQDILYHEKLMFEPWDEGEVANKVRQFFTEDKLRKDIIQLCCERKKLFLFDWKEKAFQMVTQRPFHRGEAWPSK